jgi:hypothetical protein
MKDITLKEIYKKKELAEMEISKILNYFYTETELFIKDVYIFNENFDKDAAFRGEDVVIYDCELSINL